MQVCALVAMLGCVAACDSVFSTRAPPSTEASVESPCLRDDFDANAIDSARWSVRDPAAMDVIVDAREQSVAVIAAAAAVGDNGLVTNGTYDMSGGQAIVRVPMVASDLSTSTYFAALLGNGRSYSMVAMNGQLVMYATDVEPFVLDTEPFSDSFAYWRILHFIPAMTTDAPPPRELHFDTSVDGIAWTSRHSQPAPFEETVVKVAFGVVAQGSESAGHAVFDDVQLAGPGCPIQ